MTDLIDRAALLEDVAAAETNSGMGHLVASTLRRYVMRRPAVDAVPVVKKTEEVEKAICILNVYRNTYYKEPSGTVKYAVADAINTILPLFAKCLERRTDADN